MNTNAKIAHDQKVDSLASNYSQQGFTVWKEPQNDAMPFYLGGYRPDLVAQKNNTGLIIEVKTAQSPVSVDRFRTLAQEVSSHPGWRFLLVTLDDADLLETPTTNNELPTWSQLMIKLQQAKTLIAAGSFEPSILYLWSIFEAALRKQAIAHNIPVERQPASRLLKHMYSQGEVSVNDLDLFQDFFSKRNRIAHGANEPVSENLITRIFESVHRLLTEWSHTQ